MKAPPVVILGGGDHARVVAEACRAAGREVRGFLDPAAEPGARIGAHPVLGGDERLEDAAFVAGCEFAPGIGDAALRRRVVARVRAAGGALATVIHPAAIVAEGVRIGAGTLLAAGCVVNVGARVGDFAIVNTLASVDHDDILADGVQVAPGAHLAGRVRCGEDAFIGIGAVVAPGCEIGARALIGAGAVVTGDVPADVTAVGSPARVTRRSGSGA